MKKGEKDGGKTDFILSKQAEIGKHHLKEVRLISLSVAFIAQLH